MTALALVATVLTFSPELEEGRQLYRSLRYKSAEEKLWRARESKALSQAERREVHDLLARALAAQGRTDESTDVYGLLLKVDPDAPAPEGSAPKVVNAFRRAKELADTRQPRLARVEEPTPFSEATPDAAPDPPEAASAGRPETQPPPRPPAPLVPAREPPARESVTASISAEPAPAFKVSWAAWAVAAASVLAAGTAVALAVASAQDSHAAAGQYFASDALALDRAAKDKAIAANVLFVLTLLGGASTGFMLWRWP